MRRGGRCVAACLAVLGVLGLALLPAEHVHVRTEDGQPADLIHRHFEAHHPVGSNPGLDHDEGHEATWLNSAFVTGVSRLLGHPVDQLVGTSPPTAPDPEVSPTWTPGDPESVHDPPSTSSHGLRAPPSPLV